MDAKYMFLKNRREFLATTAVIAGGLAGCSSLLSDRPPAGSLRFINNHNVPHSVTIEVTNVGSQLNVEKDNVVGDVPKIPPAQRNLTASSTVPPGESKKYTGVFSYEAWYVVEYTIDGRQPEDQTVIFNPAPPNRNHGNFVSIEISDTGLSTWVVSSTDNMKPITT